jgi:hypothetical protein
LAYSGATYLKNAKESLKGEHSLLETVKKANSVHFRRVEQLSAMLW